MTLEPLLNASPAIQVHVATVLPAALIGGWVLYGRKGTRLHKALGRTWVALMVATAVSSFFIHELRLVGDFSPIHLLSAVTLVSCAVIVWSVRTRRVEIHRRTVKSLYWGGIGIAGAFTLLPGRIMNETVFGGGAAGAPSWAIAVIAGAAAVVVAFGRRRSARAAITVAAAGLLASGNPADAAGPGASAIVTGAPPWVWPLLLGLVWLGWSRSRPRVVAKARVLVLPVVLAGIGIGSFFSNGASIAAAAALAGAMAAGSVAGRALARREGAFVDDEGKVHLPGEWVSMALILTIFAARFAAGAAQSIDPSLDNSAVIAVPLALVSGFSIGLTGMRALVQTGLAGRHGEPRRAERALGRQAVSGR